MPSYTVRLTVVGNVEYVIDAPSEERAEARARARFYEGIDAEHSSLLALEDVDAEAYEAEVTREG